MALIAKSDLLSLSIETKELDVPGSEARLRIRALSGAEVTQARRLINRAMDGGKITSPEVYAQWELYLVEHGLIDENGSSLLNRNELEQLAQRRYSLVRHIALKVGSLSGFGDDAEVAAEKN
jgi:hypothetical protein